MPKTLKCRKRYNNVTRKNKDKSIIKKFNNESKKFIDSSLVNTLISEMKNKTKSHDELPKTKFNQYSYSIEKKKSDNYGRLFYYKDNTKKLLIDWDKLSSNSAFFLVGDYEISNNEKYISYTIDKKGDRLFDLFIKDFVNDKIERITEKCASNTVFSSDSRYIYYIKYDNIDLRPSKIYCYDIFKKTHSLVFHEKNRSKMLTFNLTSDRKIITVDVRTYTTSTPYIISNNTIKKAITTKKHERVFIDHWRGSWYVLKKNYNKTSISTTTDFKNFKTILSNKKNSTYEKMFLKGDYLIVVIREKQKRHLLFYNLCTNKSKTLSLINAKYSVYFQYLSNLDIDKNTISLKYTTFINPTKLISVDMTNLKVKTVYDFKSKGYNQTKYVERIHQINKNVSITMIYKKNNSLKNQKCLLYGYGSYGHTIDPSFDPAIISLIERGFIYCYAHIRGSSFNGYNTWLDGKLMKKKNTFNDFITAGEWLIKNKYTSNDKLAIWGRSAGGLLVGSVINMKPELANLAVLGVPFVEVVDTMTDSCQPLVTEEYEEWGNPENKAIYDYMSSYDPIKNINPSSNYPNLYIYSNIDDTLVLYDQVLRYYKKIKESAVFSVGDKFALLNINLKYGHNQATKKNERLREKAEIYSMIIKY